MKKLNEKETELIEMIRNFRASKGRMEKEQEFQWEIERLLYELMFEE